MLKKAAISSRHVEWHDQPDRIGLRVLAERRGHDHEQTAVSKGVRSGAEYAFDALLRDSVINVFKGTLGKIAGSTQ